MLSQRIASLVGQYALGASDTRSDIRGAVAAFVNTDGNTNGLVSGDAAVRGPRPANSASALDSAIADFLERARRIADLPPHAVRLAAAAAPLFSAARGPLLDRLNSALVARQTQAARDRRLVLALGSVTALALLGTLLAAVFGIFRPIVRRAAQFAHDAADFERAATTDPHTGLLNGRSFQSRGEIEIHKAKRYNRALSLLIIGPDQITAVGGPAAHDSGVAILDAVAATLVNATRATDLVGRLSGEDFAVLLPETNVAGAKVLAERLHRRIGDLALPFSATAATFTVSIGVATAEADASFFAPMYRRAGEALYEARMRGRNQVWMNPV